MSRRAIGMVTYRGSPHTLVLGWYKRSPNLPVLYLYKSEGTCEVVGHCRLLEEADREVVTLYVPELRAGHLILLDRNDVYDALEKCKWLKMSDTAYRYGQNTKMLSIYSVVHTRKKVSCTCSQPK
jgi:hypothetical protein